jgi:hypothetical protein
MSPLRAQSPVLLVLTLASFAGCDPDPSDDTSPQGYAPDLHCPGDPSGGCDAVEGAPLLAGAAKASIVPDCYEIWLPEGDDYMYTEGTDAFEDCGCDRLCPEHDGYPGPDQGEGDGELQAVWLAGFGNTRAATGVRGAEHGPRGAGDGLWARALVLEQGETTLAIVTLDLIGVFHDHVDAMKLALDDAGLSVDHLLIHSLHNHEGPDTMGMWGQSIVKSGVNPDYTVQVRETVVDVVGEALADLREVELTAGEVDVSGYSAEKGVNNVIRDSRDPWVVDETLAALRLAEPGGRTVATVVAWDNHPEAMSDENTLMTSDYVHALRETVESGVAWDDHEREGVGGLCLFINGALGGMMTPLGVAPTDPDGQTWSSTGWEKTDTIGQLLGEMALDAIEGGSLHAEPQLSFAVQGFELPVENHGFQAMMSIGIFDRVPGCYDPEEDIDEDNLPCLATEVGLIELGGVRMLSIPGELLPELAVGGYDGSHVNAPGHELLDPGNEYPPDLDAAPEGPYLLERLGGEVSFIIGLGNDEVGYIIPPYDFVLNEDVPWLLEAGGDHYEETNSLGPETAPLIEAQADLLIGFMDGQGD